MSTEQTIPTTAQAGTGSGKMLIAMVGIGLLCALLIVLTYEGTKPRIETLRAEALQQAIFKVIPGITSTETFILGESGEFIPESEASGSGPRVFAGYSESGELEGIAIEASGQGYADIIRILYGYDPQKEEVVGFYVLETKETPGLGDKIEKDENFLANFDGLDLALNEAGSDVKNPVVTVKSGTKTNPWEIDGITGATISSRAIGSIIQKSSSELIPRIKENLDAFENRK